MYQRALQAYREIGDRLGEALMFTDAHSSAGTLADAVRLYRLLGRENLAEQVQRLAVGAEEIG